MFYELDTNKELNISSQFFSGTDKDHDGGVVYPLACDKSVNETLSISSIIDHHDKHLCKITEARIATADTEKKTVEYIQSKCVAVEYGSESDSLELFLVDDTKDIYQSPLPITPFLKDTIKQFIEIAEKNDSFFLIDDKLIKEKSYRSIYSKYSPSSYNSSLLFEPASKKDDELIDKLSDKFMDYLTTLEQKDLNKLVQIVDINSTIAVTAPLVLLTSKVCPDKLVKEIDKKIPKSDFYLRDKLAKEFSQNIQWFELSIELEANENTEKQALEDIK